MAPEMIQFNYWCLPSIRWQPNNCAEEHSCESRNQQYLFSKVIKHMFLYFSSKKKKKCFCTISQLGQIPFLSHQILWPPKKLHYHSLLDSNLNQLAGYSISAWTSNCRPHHNMVLSLYKELSLEKSEQCNGCMYFRYEG